MYPTDVCFLCKTENSCTAVDNKIFSLVEYLLPEIEITKLGNPLGICSMCEKCLDSFCKIKQNSVEKNLRLGAISSDAQCTRGDGAQYSEASNIQLHVENPTRSDESSTLPTNDENVKDLSVKEILNDHEFNDNEDTDGESSTQRKSNHNFEEHINRDPMEENSIYFESYTEKGADNISIKEEFNDNALQVTDKNQNMNDNNINGCKSNEIINEYKCPICHEFFIESENLLTHMKRSYTKFLSDIQKAQCLICDKIQHLCNIKRHLKSHAGIKDFHCSICNDSFTEKNSLIYHMKIHSGKKEFQCSICKRKFSMERDLNKHMKVYSKKKDSAHYKAYNDEIKKRLSVEEKSLEKICSNNLEENIINDESISKINVKSIITEYGVSNCYECHICHKKFVESKNLVRHIESHIGIPSSRKSVRCPICRKFIRNLKRHLKHHAGVKDFHCSICKKSFTSKQSLKYHMTTHVEVKKREFECDICHKQFTKKSTLKKHTDTHNIDKKHLCSICNETFTEISCLQSHNRTHITNQLHIESVNTAINSAAPSTENKNGEIIFPGQEALIENSNDLERNNIADKDDEATIQERSDQKFKEIHYEFHNAEIEVKEESVEENSSDREFYEKLVQNVVKDETLIDNNSSKDNSIEKKYILSKEEKFNVRIFSNSVEREVENRSIIDNNITNSKTITNFECPICRELFTEIENLITHMKTHITTQSNKKKVQCPTCRKFLDRDAVLIHLREHFGINNNFQCSLCSKLFAQKYDLIKHLRNHTLNEELRCSICNKLFSQIESLKLHFLIHMNTTLDTESTETIIQNIEDICNKSDKDISSKEENTNDRAFCNKIVEAIEKDETVDDNNTNAGKGNEISVDYECPLCHKLCLGIKNMISHMKTHIIRIQSNKHQALCPICSKSMLRESIRKHLRKHFEIKYFYCKLCNKSFTQRLNLIKHIKNHIVNEDLQYPVCNQVFIEKSNLLLQFVPHTPNEHQTNIPGQTVADKELQSETKYQNENDIANEKDKNIVVPEESMEGYNTYLKDCNKEMEEDSNSELETKKAQCPTLTTIVDKSILDSHLNHHTVISEFHCSVCNKSFLRKDNLKFHMMTHANIDEWLECENKEPITKDLSDAVSFEKEQLKEKSNNLSFERSNPIVSANVDFKELYTKEESMEENSTDSNDLEYNDNLVQDAKVMSDNNVNYSADNQINIDYDYDIKCHNFTIEDTNNLNSYLNHHAGNSEFDCAVCNKSFLRKDKLKFHMMTHANIEKGFKSENEAPKTKDLNDGVCFEKEQLKEKCKDLSLACSSPFKGGNVNFKEIYIKEEPMEEYSSDSNNLQCNDNLVQEAKVMSVSNVNCTTENQINIDFECPTCHKLFSRKRLLKIHIKIHTRSQSDKKNAQCSICGKFMHPSNMSRHLKIHAGIKDFHCSICNKSFTQKVGLNNHLATHSGRRDFQCAVCNKTFITKTKRNIHMKIHNKKCDNKERVSEKITNDLECKKAKCSICSKFLYPGNMKRHLNSHAGIKNFHCSICNKSFCQKKSLNYHLATHTGRRDFQCELCNKTFVAMYNLNRHIKIHKKKL